MFLSPIRDLAGFPPCPEDQPTASSHLPSAVAIAIRSFPPLFAAAQKVSGVQLAGKRSIHAQVCTPEHQSKHHRQAAKTISPPSICGLVCPRLRNVSCSNAPRTQVRPTTSHAGSHLWDSPSTLAHVSLDGHRPQHRKTTRANQPTKINHQRRASSVRAIVERRKGHAHVATALSVDNR